MSPSYSPGPSPKSSTTNLPGASTASPHSPTSPTSPASPPSVNQSPGSPRPGLSWGGPSGGVTAGGRRPSIQFVPAIASRDGNGEKRSTGPGPSLPRRMSSPPPPSTYEDRVSFDTFHNRDATDLSFTLISKHKDYVHTARSRTFLCGADQNDYSEFALEWLVDELVEDGDEIVCLRVIDKDSKINSDASLHQEKYKLEARKFLEHIQAKNDNLKSISLISEFAVGRVPETIQRMISIYAPACLIVGTRGRSLGGIQGLLPGSVSKYCLQNSPVPVVVVRPSEKREKKKKKRLANPGRRTYQDMLDHSGSHMLDKSEREKVLRQPIGEASESEAAAVAKAIGISSNMGLFAKFRKEKNGGTSSEAGPLLRKAANAKNIAREETPSPVGGLSPDDPLPGEKASPEFEKLESPASSDDEPDEEDEVNEEQSKSGGKEADVRAARKMEAGEGKHLKPDSSLTEDI